MYTLSINMWFQKLLRQFFFNLDKVVYSFISTVYDLLISISRTSVLSQADIIAMADKIYKLLAVFMVFKVTFSLIMYIVNPDDFSDKSKGVTKLGLNIVISLALLILVPYIFNAAFTLQKIVLEDNSLAELIMGNGTDEQESSILTDAGNRIAFYSIQPFFTPNVSIPGLESCGVLDDMDVNEGKCYEALKVKNVDSTLLNNYAKGMNVKSFGLMFRQDLSIATISANGEETFVIDYKFLFSTVVGVVIVLILITFCMDVALRSIKLSFLQLIAPIPIISYVDPKSGKDGLFKKWYQMCFKTYLSLFIRLIALYFAIYIIGRIGNLTDIVDGSTQTNAFVKIFIIIGALMFAEQLPKILEGLGLKLDGGFTLNPLRKIEKEALGGQLLKKPNDALAKLGKGILTSPIGGLKTLGKKTIGGIDAATHGKGFKQGFNRTHSNLYNNFYKKLDEWAPDSAEARKNERLGRENIHKMAQQTKRGEEIYKAAEGKAENLNFSAEYKKSYDAMDTAKKEMYAAEAKKSAQIAHVEELMRRNQITEEEAQRRIKDINKEAGTANKRYEVAKARHDEMKKIYIRDAMIEDAFDYYDKTATQDEKNILLGITPTSGNTQSSSSNPTSGNTQSSGSNQSGGNTQSSSSNQSGGNTQSSSSNSTSGNTQPSGSNQSGGNTP